MKATLFVARRELGSFFASPTAFLFLGGFLLISLFIVFWVETFFSRNIADIRPLFEWMPVLLVFLVAALTMRSWSDERRMGTLEGLLVTPVSHYQLVMGKFLASLWLVTIALLLTLPLPITVSLLGPLDWGPVIGGYIATLCLAAAYLSIGLFVSAQNDNQIISLLMTVLISGALYLIGHDSLLGVVGEPVRSWLEQIGVGSHFLSITRGIIDLRDLYYYISLVGCFLILNVLVLEWLRWPKRRRASHRRWQLFSVLAAANFLVGNLWLQPLNSLRLDITSGQVYSISEATRGYLVQLQEPLLVRGYFSAQTHPLLSPLVPRLRDLLIEYQEASDGRLRAEFVEPETNPELEREAHEKYGIKPVPFQISSKYQSSVVNSYFNLLIQYGDQYEVLGFRDLIDVRAGSETNIEVALRNPEYDITRAIKKVLYSYQSSGNLFQGVSDPIVFRAYISDDKKLPQDLQKLRLALNAELDLMQQQGGDKFRFEIINPEQDGGALAVQLRKEYGLQPLSAKIFDPNPFWFHLLLDDGNQVIQVPLPSSSLTREALKRSIDGALKRFAVGFLRNVALYTPPQAPLGSGLPGGKRFVQLRDQLRQNADLEETTLNSGIVPESSDILVLVSPDKFDDKQRFAVDQFLMKGGTVLLGLNPYMVSMDRQISVQPHETGLREWLAHHGVSLDQSLVLDPRNSSFPIPIERNIGGFSVQEIRMVEYPYFIDVRDDGIIDEPGLMAGVRQITMNWASPLQIDAEKNSTRQVRSLLRSSPDAWSSSSMDIRPDFGRYGVLGFPEGDNHKDYLLAAVIEGRFDSFYADKSSPLLRGQQEDSAEEEEVVEQGDFSSVIERSTDAARLIVFSSGDFLSDDVLRIASSRNQAAYRNSLQMIENAVDWSLEEKGLLSIRSRGHFSRTLDVLERRSQVFWEYLNYGLALLGLALLYIAYRLLRRQRLQRWQQSLVAKGN